MLRESVSVLTISTHRVKKRMDENQIEKMTFKFIPEPMMKGLARSVFVARKDAWEDCGQKFAGPEAENLRPFEARGRLEGLMRSVAERHPEITATVIKQPGQPWNHTELSNGPVVLTAATVQTPAEMVDAAQYRRTLAASPQIQFESMADPVPEDGLLYVLLLHSRSHWTDPQEARDYGFLPGSVYLAYPNAELKDYRHTINLFDRYPDVVKAMTPQEWDEQTFKLYIERSRRAALPRRSSG